MNELLNIIMSRMSVRKYLADKVSQNEFELIMKAGMSAPSAGNKQPWEFVLVEDRQRLERMAENLEYAKMLSSAPGAILVCSDIKRTFSGEGVDYWVQDCSAVVQNILLATHALGLGAVWTGVYPITERVSYLKNEFALPENIIPFAVIGIGRPESNNEVIDKWDEGRVHIEEW